MKEITKEQFAIWSFERDLSAGCFDEEINKPKSLNDLSSEEYRTYLDEAEMYFTLSREDWPIDILERLQ